MRTIQLGLLGCGNIGSALAERILRAGSGVEDKACGFALKKILVRDLEKRRNVSRSLLTDDFRQVTRHPDVAIVVETMGGDREPRKAILDALRHGKHVVTSNKVVMAKFGRTILQEAQKRSLQLRYEASCAAALPVLQSFEGALSGNRILRLLGILNGTTNFILTEMERTRAKQEEVLRKAQQAGYAEPDPTDDVEGHDARYKLALLCFHAFGRWVDPGSIAAEGIRRVTTEDIIYAGELGFRIKLLASAQWRGSKLDVRVHPALLPKGHPLSSVSGVYNAIFIQGDLCGEMMLFGRGAGALPTVSAILGDLRQIARGVPSPVAPLVAGEVADGGEVSGSFYLRMEVVDRPGVLAKVAAVFGRFGVSLDSVVQKQSFGKTAEIVWVTHQVEEAKIRQAISRLRQLSVVVRVGIPLRIEGQI